jgi:putative tryptophan/tyrosine transport system substrate-binding protein
MRRREFIQLVGGAAVCWPLATGAHAQQSAGMQRIGVLMGYPETDVGGQAQVAALRRGLRKLGWEEGRNILIDVRFAGADANKIRANLAELMSFTPNVIVSNTNLVTQIVQAEVHTIPIVFIALAAPVESGFVSNEARPDGNITGFANWDSSFSGKWLELLKEVAPRVERVGFLLHPESAANIGLLKFAQAAAPALKVELVPLAVHDADEIERALTAFTADTNGGFIVAPNAVNLTNRVLIVALAARLRLPAVYSGDFYPEVGGLISYGLDNVSQFEQGAGYVDRILRGAKPADLPVQYPTKFKLIINLKTAKALGLTIPESFLLRADEVIE